MPIYQFRCSACGNEFDHFQTFTEFDKGELPNCTCGHQAQREVTAPLFVFDSTPKTVGSLAERNTHKFGSYYREKMEREHEESAKKARKALSPNSSGVVNNKSKFKRYWPKMSNKALKKMSKKQLRDYVTSDTEPKEM
jgi:putative FmdB family regulatory protein